MKLTREIVTVPVPPVINKMTFEGAQKLLKARNPYVMLARVISGPTMLTGLIHCAKCGRGRPAYTGMAVRREKTGRSGCQPS